MLLFHRCVYNQLTIAASTKDDAINPNPITSFLALDDWAEHVETGEAEFEVLVVTALPVTLMEITGLSSLATPVAELAKEYVKLQKIP